MAVTRRGAETPKNNASGKASQAPSAPDPASENLEFDADAAVEEGAEANNPEAPEESKGKAEKPSQSVDEKVVSRLEAMEQIVREQARIIEEMAKARQAEAENSAASELASILKSVKGGDAPAIPTLADIQEDMLDEPVRYFAYSYKFAILGYTAPSGHEVKVPDGTEVMFGPFQRYSRKTTARGVDTVSISMFSTKSKRMVQFLDNHPFFNVRFFRATGRKDTIGVQDHMYAVDAYHKVSKMSDMHVVEMLQNLGVPSSEDIGEMRKELIRRLATEMQASAEKMMREKSKELAATALSRM